MFCYQCGEQIEEDSIFCQFCGKNIASDDSEHQSENKNSTILKKESRLLVKKFDKLNLAIKKNDESILALSSVYISELLDRLSENTFERFLQANKDELNRQPYKIIEEIKDTIALSILGGYRFWLAEILLNNNDKLNKFTAFSIDLLVEKYTNFNFMNGLETLSEPMNFCVNTYSQIQFEDILKIEPEVKNLTSALIEELKNSILISIMSGYYAGEIENTFRK